MHPAAAERGCSCKRSLSAELGCGRGGAALVPPRCLPLVSLLRGDLAATSLVGPCLSPKTLPQLFGCKGLQALILGKVSNEARRKKNTKTSQPFPLGQIAPGICKDWGSRIWDIPCRTHRQHPTKAGSVHPLVPMLPEHREAGREQGEQRGAAPAPLSCWSWSPTGAILLQVPPIYRDGRGGRSPPAPGCSPSTSLSPTPSLPALPSTSPRGSGGPQGAPAPYSWVRAGGHPKSTPQGPDPGRARPGGHTSGAGPGASPSLPQCSSVTGSTGEPHPTPQHDHPACGRSSAGVGAGLVHPISPPSPLPLQPLLPTQGSPGVRGVAQHPAVGVW